jgi:ABC-2 type transport system permease protein
MIRTIIQISLLRLWHNKAELLLTFIVPILFFSIFAWIFGSRGSGGSTPKLKVVACDEIDSPVTQRTLALLHNTKSLRFHLGEQSNSDLVKPVSRESAEALVRRGMVTAAIVFRTKTSDDSAITPSHDLNAHIPNTSESADIKSPAIEVFADSFDQVASQVIVAFVQKASMAAQAEHAQEEAVKLQAARHAASQQVQGAQSVAIPGINDPTVRAIALSSQPTLSLEAGNLATIAVPTIEVIDVLGTNKSNPIVAMYAAGIAVMFLLFSATTASGAILEERENSTLERLLCSRMTMDHLLMGKWCYLVIIGCLQTTLMFAAGAIFFGLNLLGHLDGFAVMTLVTSGAAASFALMMAAMCKTRTQLGWVSTILILSMSALGGSMVPRYLMSESIQRVGQFTFNAWALDGYNKIFWRELPIRELTLELGVLVTCAFVFMVVARVFATRWDRG